jgi:chromosome segregation ATPase
METKVRQRTKTVRTQLRVLKADNVSLEHDLTDMKRRNREVKEVRMSKDEREEKVEKLKRNERSMKKEINELIQIIEAREELVRADEKKKREEKRRRWEEQREIGELRQKLKRRDDSLAEMARAEQEWEWEREQLKQEIKNLTTEKTKKTETPRRRVTLVESGPGTGSR